MDPEVKDEGGFDMEAGVAQVAEGLGFETEDAADPVDHADPVDAAVDAAVDATVTDPPADAPIVRAPPKSWGKDKHEVWSKMDAAAQEQVETREKQMLEGLEGYKADSGLGRQMRESITPYKALLASQGVDEVKAVQVLMNAHYKLSTLPPADRNAYFASLAQTYGVDLSQAQAPQQPKDPYVQKLEERVSKFENALTQREKEAFESHRAKVSQDVNTFATDAAHPYFDEVADDIVVFINAGDSLQVAYDKAVWANQVTRAKETARLQTDADKKLREKHKGEAHAAERARSATVRSRDTRRAPTEPLGKMDDTMKEVLADIKARAH